MFTIGGEDMEGEMFTNQNGREVEMFTKRDSVIEEEKEGTCWNCVYCNYKSRYTVRGLDAIYRRGVDAYGPGEHDIYAFLP